MSELTNLVAKQNEESYQLGKKHGAIEELEKIKEEIGEAYPYFDSADVHWGFNICRDILDNRIKELKGESNE